jgi:hypothetical protein
MAPAISVPDQEAFFNDLASNMQMGLAYKNLTSDPTAIQAVTSAAAATASSTEASLQASTPDTVMSEPLFKRALVAECALQAVQKIDVPTLQNSTLYDEQANPSTEGFFDSLKTTMQGIGSSVVDIAGDVVQNVAPIALNLVAGAIAKQPVVTGGGGGGTEGDIPPPSGGGSTTLSVHISIAALADRQGTVGSAPAPAPVPAPISIGALSAAAVKVKTLKSAGLEFDARAVNGQPNGIKSS